MVRKGINLPTLQTEQVKRYSVLAHLGVKNMPARARQVASKNHNIFFATLARTVGTLCCCVPTHFVWYSQLACRLVFFRQAFVRLSFAAIFCPLEPQ